MTEEEDQAQAVIMAFRGFRDEIGRIINALDGKTTVSRGETEELQGMLKELKERIKQAAKVGTVSGLCGQPNQFDKAYFAPALAKAASRFHIKTNSHPINSNWASELYSVQIDITHPLFELEQQFPNI